MKIKFESETRRNGSEARMGRGIATRAEQIGAKIQVALRRQNPIRQNGDQYF